MVKVLSTACLGYEFLGMAFITMAYNLHKGQGYTNVIFAVSIWAWNLGAAHFNMAVSIGAFILNTGSVQDIKNTIGPFFLLLLI